MRNECVKLQMHSFMHEHRCGRISRAGLPMRDQGSLTRFEDSHPEPAAVCMRSYRPQPVSAGLFPLSAPSRACVCSCLVPEKWAKSLGSVRGGGFASGCDAAKLGSWERTSGHCVDLDRAMAWHGMAIYTVGTCRYKGCCS